MTNTSKCLVISADRLTDDDIRLIKATVYGRTREVQQVLPYGIDSAPMPKDTAIITGTGAIGDDVIIGYVHKDAQAEPGSIRIYSEGGDITITKTGTIELNGNTDNVTMWAALNTALQAMVSIINSNSTAITTAIGVPLTPITLNISAAKSNTVKIS